MPKLADLVRSVRSKNAGPFWITLDIFCNNQNSFDKLCKRLGTNTIARAFDTNPRLCKRFEIRSLAVIKFSFPRTHIQGSIDDRDMHGAAVANLVLEMNV